jgi:hypothetical protein
MTYERFTQSVVRPMLAVSVALSALLLVVNMAVAQTSYTDWAITEMSRRLTLIEGQNIESRLRVLESDMAELKWLSRSVAVAVIGQFAVAGMGALRRSKP